MIWTKLINCLGIICLLIWVGCASGSGNLELIEKDLLPQGIAVTLQVPDSADIKVVDWGLQKDVTITDDWYNLQIFSSQALKHNLENLKNEYLEEVKGGPYFTSIIADDTDGFIFETTVDSIVNYDFRHFKIQGDNEYIFQGGLMAKFDLEQVKKMYEIAQLAK